MDPTPATPFADIGPERILSVRCGRVLIEYRTRNFPADLSAGWLCAKWACKHCGRPVPEVTWESVCIRPGGLQMDRRAIRVV